MVGLTLLFFLLQIEQLSNYPKASQLTYKPTNPPVIISRVVVVQPRPIQPLPGKEPVRAYIILTSPIFSEGFVANAACKAAISFRHY
jgi:hypothetical protein